MKEDFPIHWLGEILNKIETRDLSEITLSTGKIPSGHIHLGILREIIICDSIRRILEKRDKKVNFYLFLDSLDAAKRFPDYINQKFQKLHRGKPFALIPCPFTECKCESYAHHFGNELISTFEEFGIKNEIIWTHELYQKKGMQELIKKALENTKKIKEILRKYILPTLSDEKKVDFIEMQKNWMPVMVICEKCEKIQHRSKDDSIIPNRVLKYMEDMNKVEYRCSACGYNNEISIYSGRLKLNWRVDWPAKWALFNITCEPAGKDHCVKGGAYDTGLEICKEIYEYEGPIKVAYEWLRLGDRDMKTSKGIVFTPSKYLKIADPEIFRMLILRTNPMKHISLRIEEMSQYYDYYNRLENIYYTDEEAESEDEKAYLRFMYPLIKSKKISNKNHQKIPFKLLVFLSQLQNILSLDKLYEKAISVIEQQNFKNKISFEEFSSLINHSRNWVDEVNVLIENEKNEKNKRNLLKKVSIFNIPEKMDKNILNDLSNEQIQGISLIREYILAENELEEHLIQNKIFTIAKEDLKIAPKKMFEALYQVLLSKKFGPRLGSFLVLLDKNWLLERLKI